MSADFTTDDVKKMTLSLINANLTASYYHHWLGEPSRVFENLYPETWEKIEKWKFKDHKRLSNALQRIESNLMIKTVYKKLLDDAIPAFSIHDGILTTKEHCEHVRAVILKESEKMFGIKPKVKAK